MATKLPTVHAVEFGHKLWAVQFTGGRGRFEFDSSKGDLLLSIPSEAITQLRKQEPWDLSVHYEKPMHGWVLSITYKQAGRKQRTRDLGYYEGYFKRELQVYGNRVNKKLAQLRSAPQP